MFKTMNRVQVEKLIKTLPLVAKRYFDGKMEVQEHDLGMCWGVKRQYANLGYSNTAYHDLGDLLNSELRFHQTYYLENVVPTHKNWEQRAIMCLFLAEFLKGEQNG